MNYKSRSAVAACDMYFYIFYIFYFYLFLYDEAAVYEQFSVLFVIVNRVFVLCKSTVFSLRAVVILLRATAYMLSAHTLSQFRLSVRPSVKRMNQSKTAEVRIMQFSPYSSAISLVFER